MGLPAPNLDDRRYNDLVQEAFQLIQQRCPEWTDFNPSDPGVMLVELMAWMTESTLYRLNRVPEKHYVKFLDLLGISLKSATPAKGWVHFTMKNSIKETTDVEVQAGTQLIAKTPLDEEIVFTTQEHLNLTTANLVKLISVYGDQWRDHTNRDVLADGEAPQISFGTKGVTLFDDLEPEQQILYLGTDDLGVWAKCARLHIDANVANSDQTGVQLEWEYFSQKQWHAIIPVQDTWRGARADGTLRFDPIPEMDMYELDGRKAYWIRARLLAQAGRESPLFSRLQQRIEIIQDGGLPIEKAILNIERESKDQEISFPTYQELDISKEFYPFGKHPRIGDIWYVHSAVFDRRQATIELHIQLAEQYTPTSSESLGDLEILWEYFDESGEWRQLGQSVPSEKRQGNTEHFQDETNAFIRTGKIMFNCPTNMGQTTVMGTRGCFVRAKIQRGDYGVKSPNPPCFASVRARFIEHGRDWPYLITQRRNEAKVLVPQGKKRPTLRPFETETHTSPTVYLALDRLPANKTQRLYVSVQEASAPLEGQVTWEYQSDEGWKPLSIKRDRTEGFTQSGAIDYLAPLDWTPDHRFGLKDAENNQDWHGYWIRIRWLDWSGRAFPAIRGIWCNMAEVDQIKVLPEETVFSGNGQAFQTILLDHHPLQPGLHVWVRKVGTNATHPIQPLESSMTRKPNSQKEKKDSDWEMWTRVTDFMSSSGEDAHYILDDQMGRITFGDGKRGKIPTAGHGSIKVSGYRLTQGRKGNVEPGAIATMAISISEVESVTNPEGTHGGIDGETLEEAMRRAPARLVNRNRAVTLEDFEALSREASRDVGKVKAQMVNQDVHVILIPQTRAAKPLPSKQLLTTVKDYLDRRRVLSVPLKMMRPSYLDIQLDIQIVLKAGNKDRESLIRHAMMMQIQNTWHPIIGGEQGEGWPMGRAVHVSELYQLIEQLSEIDFVDQLIMWTGNLRQKHERIAVPIDGYPALGQCHVEIVRG